MKYEKACLLIKICSVNIHEQTERAHTLMSEQPFLIQRHQSPVGSHCYSMIDRGCHSDKGSNLVSIEIWGLGRGSEGEGRMYWCWFRSVSTLHPLHSVPVLHPPHPPLLYILYSLHPPITCHPKGVIQASSLEKNGLKREAGLLSVSFSCACVCMFVCMLGLNTLFVVCVRLCVRRGG